MLIETILQNEKTGLPFVYDILVHTIVVVFSYAIEVE